MRLLAILSTLFILLGLLGCNATSPQEKLPIKEEDTSKTAHNFLPSLPKIVDKNKQPPALPEI